MHLPTFPAVLAAPALASAEIVAPRHSIRTVASRETWLSGRFSALEVRAGQMPQTLSFNVVWNGSFQPGAAGAAGADGSAEWRRIDERVWDAATRVAPDAPAVGTMWMRLTNPALSTPPPPLPWAR